jgi:hypothetical protein
MKALFLAFATLVVGASIGGDLISTAYARTDGAAAANREARYGWQYGYGKGGRAEWHWARVR